MKYFILFILLSFSIQLSADLNQAKNNYVYGNYKKTIEILNKIIMDLETETDKITAYELLGACYFFIEDNQKSKDSFINLLGINPEYKIDPLLYPPNLLAFFDKVFKEFDEKNKLIKIIENKDKKNDVQIIKEEIVLKELEEKHIYIEKTNYISMFIPFGYAQYRNGDMSKCYMFLTTESVLLITNIASYWMVESFKDENGYFTGENKTNAKVYQTIQTFSLIGLIGFFIYGMIDGMIYYNPVFEQKIEIIKHQPIKISFFNNNFFEIKFDF